MSSASRHTAELLYQLLEIFQADGFFHNLAYPWHATRKTRDGSDGQRGKPMRVVKSVQKRRTIHHRHHQIQQHEAGLGAEGHENLQSFGSVLGTDGYAMFSYSSRDGSRASKIAAVQS